jgi:RNA polymerase sigma factor (sigma-70 family)
MCAQQHRRVGGRELDAATLFARAQNGCVRSLDQLMCQHDGLVQAVVRRQVLGDLSFEEALQAGRIGLWHAILGYDPSRGLAFSTYAWPAIMRYVWQAVKVQRREQGHARVAKEAVGATADPVETVVDEAVYRAIYRLVQGLPERLRDVVVARYGLGAALPALYREIGASLGVKGVGPAVA